MSDLLAGWLDLCADSLSPITMREYRRLVDKRIVPAIGAVAVTKLTTRVLDDYYLALSREAGGLFTGVLCGVWKGDDLRVP